MLKKTL